MRFLILVGFVALLSACETAPPRPNILLVISDDQSFPHTSRAGCGWIETPGFDRVAAEGLYFTNGYAGSPGCAPSRSALVTGRYPWQNEQAGQHAAGWLARYVPFVDALDSGGYFTGYTGKGVGPFQYGEPGLRADNAAGPHRYSDIKHADDERPASGIGPINYFANFKQFLDDRPDGEPFFFWLGTSEPHRPFEAGSWRQAGKALADVTVPPFLPDVPEVRGDLLDYAVEVEWFDAHLLRVLEHLEAIGELDNTVVVVTSDNGMSFPRAKANAYDWGIHVPLAIRYPARFPAGRTVETPVSFVDLAPTLLELAGVPPTGMLPMTGESLVSILEGEGDAEATRTVLSGRERHSSSRYQNWGYPQRALRRGDYLLVWNQRPERWPAGAPQRLVSDTSEALHPRYGLDTNGLHQSEWAFTDIDAAPSKSFIVEHYNDPRYASFFEFAVGKRPEWELFDVTRDAACLRNLADDPEHQAQLSDLRERMTAALRETKDPRVVGPDAEVFDTYPRYSRMRHFPAPEEEPAVRP
ncbi:MAG: sulfatase [Catalinimonas sp.]